MAEEPRSCDTVERRLSPSEELAKEKVREAYTRLFRKVSLGDMVRALPTAKAQELLMLEYIQKRLRTITDPDEQIALAQYLASNTALPGSGKCKRNPTNKSKHQLCLNLCLRVP